MCGDGVEEMGVATSSLFVSIFTQKARERISWMSANMTTIAIQREKFTKNTVKRQSGIQCREADLRKNRQSFTYLHLHGMYCALRLTHSTRTLVIPRSLVEHVQHDIVEWSLDRTSAVDQSVTGTDRVCRHD